MKKQRVKNPSRKVGKKDHRTGSKDDDFFEGDAKRRRKSGTAFGDKEDLESLPSDESEDDVGEEEHDEEPESPRHARYRLAAEHLERIQAAAKKLEEDEGAGEGDEMNREEREGRRDSLVAELLQKDQLESSGRARRLIASR